VKYIDGLPPWLPWLLFALTFFIVLIKITGAFTRQKRGNHREVVFVKRELGPKNLAVRNRHLSIQNYPFLADIYKY
jgi:hypothetical protein